MKFRNINTFVSICIFVILAVLLNSCEESYIPKPRGYLRIALPEKNYINLDKDFPYTFEYPDCAIITPDYNSPNEKYWVNLYYPQFKGVLHLSYKKIENDNLLKFMEDAHVMANKHIPKATSIEKLIVYQPENKRYGLIYKIKGIGTASPFQFFVTDSTEHFLRGALYFNVKPNNDSLAPVIDFIEKDIDHLIETLNWK